MTICSSIPFSSWLEKTMRYTRANIIGCTIAVLLFASANDARAAGGGGGNVCVDGPHVGLFCSQDSDCGRCRGSGTECESDDVCGSVCATKGSPCKTCEDCGTECELSGAPCGQCQPEEACVCMFTCDPDSCEVGTCGMTGACCLAGLCDDTGSETDCKLGNGTYLGDGMTCSGVDADGDGVFDECDICPGDDDNEDCDGDGNPDCQVPAPVPNNECIDAFPVGVGTVFGSTSCASGTGQYFCENPSSSPDVWYEYTNVSQCDVEVTATTCNAGSNYDTFLSAHDVCGNPLVACDDDDNLCPNMFRSTMTWMMSGEETYFIRVSGFGLDNVGDFQMDISVAGDSDGDGVINECDGCPNTPPDSAVDKNGCEIVAITPRKDNTLFNTGTDASSGAGDAVFSGKTGLGGGGTVQRAVLAFDVTGNVPPGSTITAASLTLTLVQAGLSGDQSHSLHRLTADWGEGMSVGIGGNGAPAMSGDATWSHTFFPDSFWTSPGGDFDPVVSATQVVGLTPMGYTWESTPQLVADVQDMLDDYCGNFGWLVQGNEIDFNSAKKFASKENLTPALWPVLTVSFERTASPIPADCNDDGVVDLLDYGDFAPCLLGPHGGLEAECKCFDVDFDCGVSLRDFASLQVSFGD